MSFEDDFRGLTGREPFPWQVELWRTFVEEPPDNWPKVVDIPTGLGKTSVVPIWLLALASRPENVPRRLIYVVNRRTVVDQTTEEVLKIRQNVRKLSHPCIQGLAISTLRGEYADNGEWKTNPSNAAIIVGTVDMIGSKLLFSGYGDSRRMRPLHAGLLGCDTFFVHDEAHLTPAFGRLLREVVKFQSKTAISGIPRMAALDLSATQRDGNKLEGESEVFRLTAADHDSPIVQERLNARKWLRLQEIGKPRRDEKRETLQEKIAVEALKYKADICRVVVFVHSPGDAAKIAEALKKDLDEKEHGKRVSLLTGQIRGHERDLLLEREGMQSFLGKSAPKETVYLVATAAGEVGINLHADHMVCDLTTLDSMIQRLGRVNRFGDRDDTLISCIYEEALRERLKIPAGDESDPLAVTLGILQRGCTDGGVTMDVSPASLGRLLETIDARKAFSPPPEMYPLTDILLDLWSQTSVSSIPARPEPEAWLHGAQEDYPRTFLAWRNEVPHLSRLTAEEVEQWLDAHPVISRERIQIPTSSLKFKDFSDQDHERPVIVLSAQGRITKSTLGKLANTPTRLSLNYATVILDSSIGGLTLDGYFDPKAKKHSMQMDVADDGSGLRLHLRRQGGSYVWSRIGEETNPPFEAKSPATALRELEKQIGHKVVLKFKLPEGDEAEYMDDEEVVEEWVLLARPPRAKATVSTESSFPTIETHIRDVAEAVGGLALALNMPDNLRQALSIAARYHDMGKADARWQRAAGYDPAAGKTRYAKGPTINWRMLDGYRHETGSLLYAKSVDEIAKHPEKDLILHLIAAHHGWARPHFEGNAFGSCAPEAAGTVAYETMLRYVRLQRRFGWWGLAWLESILRRADALASANELPVYQEDLS